MAIKPYNYEKPQEQLASGTGSSTIKPFQYELAPQEKAPSPTISLTKPPQRVLSKLSEFIAGSAEAPTYTTGSKTEILKNLPNEIVRTLLPGAAALNDNPELAYEITNKDIIKEVPGAVFESFIAPVASYPLTFAGVGNTLMGKSPEISFEVPGLGKVTNVQARIAEQYSTGNAPTSKVGTTVVVAKETGIELLNGLFTASMVKIPFTPRPEAITPKSKSPITIPKNEGTFQAPKTGQLYEQPTFTKPIDSATFKKITTENNIPVLTTYNPKNPTFFRATNFQGENRAFGQFFQVKPSYYDTMVDFMKKGKTTGVPKTEIIPVAEVSKPISPLLPVKSVDGRITSTPVPVETIPFDPTATTPVVKTTTPQELEAIQKTNPQLFNKAQKSTTVDEFVSSVVKSDKTTIENVDVPTLTDFFNKVKNVEEDNVPNEIEVLDSQLQAQAEEDWANTVADDYAGLEAELSDLKNQIKEASKNEQSAIQTKIDEINSKLGNIEDTFVEKWGNEIKKAKAPKKEKIVKTKTSEKVVERKVEKPKEGYTRYEVEVNGQKFFADYNPNQFGAIHVEFIGNKAIPVSDTGYKSYFMSESPESLGITKDNIQQELQKLAVKIAKEEGASTPKTKKDKVSSEILKPKKEVKKGSTKPQKQEIKQEDKIANTQKKTELEILEDLVASNPLSVNAKNDRLLYDIKEGGIRELGDVKSTKISKFMEDRMAEAGIRDPREFVDKYEALLEQKAKIKELKGQLKGVKPSGFASMEKFIEDVTPTETKIESDIKPIEFPELVRLAKQLIGQFPEVKYPRFRPSMGGRPFGLFTPSGDGKITINPDLFKIGNEQQLARTMAHEIGHLIDYLPDKTMARGNVLGRLAVLKNFRKDFFEDAGITRTNTAMKKELWDLSKTWKPIDEEKSTPSFLAYRKSPEEVYADFISVLFNKPELAQQIAPESYNVFFKRLDQKPDVKVAYFELQKLLSGTREDVLKARSADIKAGFEKAEALQKDFEEKKKLARNSSWERLRQQLDDVNYPILKRQKELEAKGQYLPEDESPKYLLEEQSYADNENFLMMSKIDDTIDKPLLEAGLTREDFGEFLFLNRVVGKNNVPEETRSEDAIMGETTVGEDYTVTEMTSDELLNQPKKAPEPTDRQNLANPFGFQIESAKEQLDFIKKTIGEEKYKVLEESAQKFHDIIFKSVEEAVNTGAYNRELFETKIKPNKDTYVTFAVVDYLQDKVPATIKAQHGTLKEIANPYVSTILKTIALNRLNAYQRAKVATKGLLEKTGEITPSKAITTDGKLTIYKVAPDKGEFTLLEDGKLKSYDVDPYIAESFKRDKVGDLNSIVWLLDTFNNKLFKPVVTTYNLGFAAAFNPIRDFKRNYKNIPSATLSNLLTAYVKSLPSAVRYTRGELDEFTKSLVESKAINAPSNDYQFDLSDDSQYQRILERYGLLPKKDGGILKGDNKAINLTKVLLKPVTKTLEGIRFIANTLEIVSKIAGGKVRIAGGEQGKELAYNLRNYTGTPNFRRKGSQTRTTNAVFTFSNIMKEGMKTDFQMATNPKTRSGYWWKTVKVDLLPKLFMFLAAGGYLGKELEDMYAKMTEYDKSNYLTIPLGETEGGKVVYIRIPHDETGRLVSATFWKMLNFAKDKETKDLQDIFSYGAGQIPQINQAIGITSGWIQYLSGRNPYDAFRGRTVIDDTTFTAGGGGALKKMTEWTISELGLATFASYDTSKDTTAETFMRISPFFNRVVKISDYGLTEQLNSSIKEQKKAEAKTSLLKRDILRDYSSKIEKPEDITPMLLIDLEKAVYGKDSNDNTKRTNLKNSLLKNLIRNDSPEVNSLLTATSNAQKLKTLQEIQKTMSTDDFFDLKQKLVKYKVVSADLIKQIK